MTSFSRNSLLRIGVFLFFIGMAAWVIIHQRLLKKQHVLGTAKVYNFSTGGRGDAGSIWIDYKYEINDTKFTGSSIYSTTKIKYEGLEHFINKTFPIIYNPEFPSISSLMLVPKDFKDNGFSFPDSLNWVLVYLK